MLRCMLARWLVDVESQSILEAEERARCEAEGARVEFTFEFDNDRAKLQRELDDVKQALAD